MFTVETDSTVKNIRIIESVHPLLDSEAIRLIKLTDKLWVPVRINGRLTRSSHKISISFEEDEFWMDQKETINPEKIYDRVDTGAHSIERNPSKMESMLKEQFKCPGDSIYANAVIEFEFVINQDSTVSNIEIKGIDGMENSVFLERELNRILHLTDKQWVPAIKEGVYVKSRRLYRYPVCIQKP